MTYSIQSFHLLEGYAASLPLQASACVSCVWRHNGALWQPAIAVLVIVQYNTLYCLLVSKANILIQKCLKSEEPGTSCFYLATAAISRTVLIFTTWTLLKQNKQILDPIVIQVEGYFNNVAHLVSF